MARKKSALIGEYRQQDGWHAARIFTTTEEADAWRNAVNESPRHEHARRTRRVEISSRVYSAALDAELSAE